MKRNTGYYKDKSGDTWLRLGKLAIVHSGPNCSQDPRPSAVWDWKYVKAYWGPLTKETP